MRAFQLALLGIAVTAMAGVSAPALAGNLLANGNFENTGFGGTTGYYNIGPGGDHAVPSDFGWTVSDGNVDIVANNASYGPILTGGGNYVLDLVGYGSTGEISQSVDTVLNQTYDVTFDYSSNNGINGPTASVNGNDLIGTVTGTHSWQVFTGSFVGTGSPTTFSISEIYGANNAGVFLDNVSVAAAPEPAAWAMLLLGVGGVGAAVRMSKRRERAVLATA